MFRLCDGIEYLRSLPDKSIDGIFTDPPWGVRISKSSTGHRKADNMIQGQSNWLYLIKAMTDEAGRILKPDGKCLIWLGMRHMGDAIKSISSLEYRWAVFCSFVPPRFIAGFISGLDPILYYAPPMARWPKNPDGRRISQVYIKASTGRKDTLHPCARPFKTVKQILGQWFSPGDYIIDPFAGSDTTGVACEELGIKYDSCEIDPIMYETGLERHKKHGAT